MIKNDLRERGFAEQERAPKESRISLIWGSLMFVFTFGTAAAVIRLLEPLGIGLSGGEPERSSAIDLLAPFGDSFTDAFKSMAKATTDFADGMFLSLGQLITPEMGTVLAIFIYILTFIFTYLGLKVLLTIAVCRDKHRSIKLKILENKAIPICECKEGLKVWQVILINLTPFVLLYPLLFILSLLSEGGIMYVLPLFVLLFYGTFDITLVLYVLRIKIAERIDYISVNHHVYNLTLYSKSYIKRRKRNA